MTDIYNKYKNYKGLAIEGGGVAGLAYIGSLKIWTKYGYDLTQFTHFAGSSAGAILATFMSLRAPLKYMENKLWNTDFSKFMDDSWGILGDMWRFWENYGWYKGDALLKWLEDAGTILTLTSSGQGMRTLEKPEKIYLNNFN